MVKKSPGMVHASRVLIQITGLYTHGISCFFLHPVPPPSNHYIPLSITFPGSKNVTHIYTNMRTCSCLPSLPAPRVFPPLKLMLLKNGGSKVWEKPQYLSLPKGVWRCCPYTTNQRIHFSPNTWKDVENLTKSQSCFLLNGGRPKCTHSDPCFFLGLASWSKASQCHDLQIPLLDLVTFLLL